MTTKYAAWSPYYGQDEEDGIRRTARDYEGSREIATAWAEWHDISGAEYDIAGQNKTVRVLVRDLSTDEVVHWDVSGEAVPSYSARHVALPAYPDVAHE